MRRLDFPCSTRSDLGMNRHHARFVLTLLLGISATFWSLPVMADEVPDPGSMSRLTSDDRLPGIGLAEGITQVTGVAISPLLGVSGVGAWQYFRTPETLRDQLPWFCHPVAWGIGAGLLALCFLKDTFGTALPAVFKKPLDLIEVFEDKLSAVLAGSAFVPFIAAQIATHFDDSTLGPTSALTSLEGSVIASAAPFMVGQIGFSILLVPVLLLSFGVVWLLSHSFTVLIMLSPFGMLDSLLKLARLLFLVFLTIVSVISPVLGAILCLGIIAVAAWLAPRAFRLCVFGTVMSVDFLRSLIVKSQTPNEARGFLARQASENLQVRSYGALRRGEDGTITFVSRRLFLGPSRSLKLPSSLKVQKGFLFPSLVTDKKDGSGTLELIHLLPRHRHHIGGVATKLGISETLEPAVTRGIKAMKAWLQSMWRIFQRKPEIDTR